MDLTIYNDETVSTFDFKNPMVLKTKEENIMRKGTIGTRSNIGSIESVSSRRFQERLCNFGMMVREIDGKLGFFGGSYRKLSYEGDRIFVSSIYGTKMIKMNDIKSCINKGKVLVMDTKSHGKISLIIPRLTDAIAFKNILG